MMTARAVPVPRPDPAQALVRRILSLGVDGLGPIKGAEQIAAEHLETHGDVELAITRIIKTHTRMVAASGFATGFGGFTVAAVTIPADVTALYGTAARCAGAIAVLRGYDVHSEEVKSVIVLTLLGSAGAGVLADVGADVGTKLAVAGLGRLPGRVLIEINKKVGFRLLTKFGTKGAVNLVKLVPSVGGVAGAGVNVVTMRTVARYAKQNFPAATHGEAETLRIWTAREEILAALPGLRARLGRDTFTPAEVIEELQRRGSRVAPATIRTHVVSRMCADASDHHARVFEDFDRVGRGLYRLRQPS